MDVGAGDRFLTGDDESDIDGVFLLYHLRFRYVYFSLDYSKPINSSLGAIAAATHKVSEVV